MSKGNYSDEFNRDAVLQITERDYSRSYSALMCGLKDRHHPAYIKLGGITDRYTERPAGDLAAKTHLLEEQETRCAFQIRQGVGIDRCARPRSNGDHLIMSGAG